MLEHMQRGTVEEDQGSRDVDPFIPPQRGQWRAGGGVSAQEGTTTPKLRVSSAAPWLSWRIPLNRPQNAMLATGATISTCESSILFAIACCKVAKWKSGGCVNLFPRHFAARQLATGEAFATHHSLLPPSRVSKASAHVSVTRACGRPWFSSMLRTLHLGARAAARRQLSHSSIRAVRRLFDNQSSPALYDVARNLSEAGSRTGSFRRDTPTASSHQRDSSSQPRLSISELKMSLVAAVRLVFYIILSVCS